jgi:IS30 family transposase
MGQNKGKQFNLVKRNVVSKMIASKMSAKSIGYSIGMSPTSISREIHRNRIEAKAKEEDSFCSKCLSFYSCRIKHVCNSNTCFQRCVGCKMIKKCPNFEPFTCKVEKRRPFVCNGCTKETRCPLKHYYYYPDDADLKAKDRLIDTRSGVDMNESEFNEVDNTLYDAIIIKKQSIHHALVANKEIIKCSEKTIYRRIEKGIFRVRNIDLPRKPGLKIRHHKKMADKYAYVHKKDVNRTGHLYSDWLVYRETHQIFYYFQMDFLGKPNSSSKEVLVFTIPGLSFTMLYLLENSTNQKVAELFDMIEKEIGIETFRKLFPSILTDRDVVFDDYSRLEGNELGEMRTSIFFCGPGASTEKPNVENMNGQLRIPFPKKAILNEYNQEELYYIASNMNSRLLSSIDDKTPYDLFSAIYGEEVLAKLHIKKISAKDVSLKPIH